MLFHQACKFTGMFNVGEDFDDETDWGVVHESAALSTVPVAMSTGLLRAPVVSCALTDNEQQHLHYAPRNDPEKLIGTGSSFDKASLQSASESSSVVSPETAEGLAVVENGLSTAPLFNALGSDGKRSTEPFLDEFDDWDLDLDALDNAALQEAQPILPKTEQNNLSQPKGLQCLTSPSKTSPVRTLRRSACERPTFINPVRSPHPAVCPYTLKTPVPKTNISLQNPARSPHVVPSRPTCVFQSSPAMPKPAARGSPAVTARFLHKPIVTNHLVQLVSAASTTPQKPCTFAPGPKTRRFPGPAGILPQQHSARNMDDIVVSTPHTPTHGAISRQYNQVSSFQLNEHDDFSGGPWARMKAEMGLNERNSACFLQSYSIVMVLRKAALKQLPKNKVPNMAVVVNDLIYTHADGKAVFKDPTGKMKGTVHRQILEERNEELKPGAVLLLKSVGVFSPSLRNHYLNVTPNNLLKIYTPDHATWSSPQLSHKSFVSEPEVENTKSSPPPGSPRFHMNLVYEDNDTSEQLQATFSSTQGTMANLQQATPSIHESEEVEETPWDADDLDQLLGELPMES